MEEEGSPKRARMEKGTMPDDIRKKIEETTEEEWDRVMAVNAKAPMLLTQQAWPHLVAAERGKVVSIVSLSGKRVLGLNAGYQMTKHAAVALSHAARRAGWDSGVRACAICPGFTATDMTLRHDLPREEITQPADLGRLVAEIVRLPNSASVSELAVNWRYEPGL